MGKLVLTRMEGEKLLIGDDITVTIERVVRRSRPQVSLSIEAPKDVIVLREELKGRPSGRERCRREGGDRG